jgi:hypothetical protein
MNRNIAFLILSKGLSLSDAYVKSKEHFLKLCQKFKYHTEIVVTSPFEILIAYEGALSIEVSDDSIEFPVGNLNDSVLESDRFLKVFIKKQTVKIENDYAGSIPVFYSLREDLVLSNIEPCVVLGSGASVDDLSYENIYGFMRYMHFIWDETAYKHIFNMLPDSLFYFDAYTLEVKEEYLGTVKSTRDISDLSDKEVADKLNKLNDDLVYGALEGYTQIILPLSSGYDSRMILASLCKRDDLKEKLHCFTYGSEGSVEVEAARRLTAELGVRWDYIELPRRFLTKDYLFKIHDIFGSSMHMHGMYQIEFFEEITKKIQIDKGACLTSGFMTGVPAGQHNSLLDIDRYSSLTDKMNKFSQSSYWSDAELNSIDLFKGKNYINKAEERFKKAFDRFEGEVYQKAVMFDIWTRQRNFISYYPRTLEWVIPTVSPHMNKEYISFFMSISKKHLDNRLAVELMFSKCYPKLSRIVSNSNGVRSINSLFENGLFFMSRVLKVLRINSLLPMKYQNNSFEFNLPAVRHSEKNSFYPLLNRSNALDRLLSKAELEFLYAKSYDGDIESYGKILTIQSIALSMLRSGSCP